MIAQLNRLLSKKTKFKFGISQYKAIKQKGRLARWEMNLQQYDFTICYIKGVNNPVADVLSRDSVEEIIQLNSYNFRKREPVQQKDTSEKIDNIDLFKLSQIDWPSEQSKDKVLVKKSRKRQFKKKEGIVF
eukprot:NODE_695_length_4670_cov_0.352439.p5 type:complete len:131 gc:universal NODE_695_length_4670_cov_0.352439:4455-4063(-)